MRILMLTSRFGFGYGMGYSAYKEATAFISLGHSVTVVHCYINPEIAHFSDPRITFIYLPIKKTPLIGFLLYSLKLKKFADAKINLKNFDIVYIQSLEFGLLNLAKIKIPTFYFARSTMRGMQQALQNVGLKTSFFSKIINLILVALERRCMRYSKMIFVKSRKMSSEISRLYGIDLNKLAVITGGIDDKDFQIESASSCIKFKRKLRIPLKVPVMLYAGRIVPQKGLIYFIKAALQLLADYDFVIIIAGSYTNKDYLDSITKLLNNNAYRKSFHFLKHVHQLEISSIFNIANCIITPSLYEPFGMVNLQAAFLGKTVITTDITGSIDVLRDYPNLRVIRPGSVETIKVSLREILSTPENTNMRPFDFRQYSWMNVAKKILEYFNLPKE